MSRTLDLTGKRYCRLLVKERYCKNNRNEWLWLCKCDCGNITLVTTYRLIHGKTQSCGCIHNEIVGKINYIHGGSNERLFKTWHDIIERTTNKNNKNYDRYGGRGISLCEEWKKYIKFREWALQSGYNDSLTIDRIDNNKSYCPENCRWVTKNEQNKNKSDNVMVEYNGKKQILSEWAKELQINYSTLNKRLKRGWSIEKAFETPIQ